MQREADQPWAVAESWSAFLNWRRGFHAGKDHSVIAQAVLIAVILGIVARSVGPAFTHAGTDRAICTLIDGLEKTHAASLNYWTILEENQGMVKLDPDWDDTPVGSVCIHMSS
jgi:hypothetical protein